LSVYVCWVVLEKKMLVLFINSIDKLSLTGCTLENTQRTLINLDISKSLIFF
jgi:hypothetical protein